MSCTVCTTVYIIDLLYIPSKYDEFSIYNSTFINNTGTNGIVSLGYLPFNLSGTNKFIGNTGSSLRVSQYIDIVIVISSTIC